ncbi:triphosphoribosyl-dephospho-CoA synthase [Aureimonas altamirensis]|uniref:triphosphoribosyl-dephospho-CoA synthase n=1 Tax=Aureimonas altamirensis TaxID=370622 RepID=UPI002036EEB0|nr:triphosphoribosyl-dephospho-CoA synthase [Aureimonas altamirensis]MCM2502225.1 triphosphoribosyl-dephospho-CoA synthase [Aureimonas altamirensis]
MKTPDDIAALFVRACNAELAALKPGNVHRFEAGHGMTVADFETSADVSAPAICAPGAGVGARILAAVSATRGAVGQNTNLGILLLCAPLAKAAERPGASLRGSLDAVLADLRPQDAEDAFRAIALAAPGGLGTAPEADVRRPPPVGLRDAMRLAADRDLIARQYANGYAEIFAIGVPLAAGRPMDRAAQDVFLAFAATVPDSHVARKFGSEAAIGLMHRFRALVGAPREALAAFDGALKAEGLNPGTSADMTVASLFAAALDEKTSEPGGTRLAGHGKD